MKFQHPDTGSIIEVTDDQAAILIQQGKYIQVPNDIKEVDNGPESKPRSPEGGNRAPKVKRSKN